MIDAHPLDTTADEYWIDIVLRGYERKQVDDHLIGATPNACRHGPADQCSRAAPGRTALRARTLQQGDAEPSYRRPRRPGREDPPRAAEEEAKDLKLEAQASADKDRKAAEAAAGRVRAQADEDAPAAASRPARRPRKLRRTPQAGRPGPRRGGQRGGRQARRGRRDPGGGPCQGRPGRGRVREASLAKRREQAERDLAIRQEAAERHLKETSDQAEQLRVEAEKMRGGGAPLPADARDGVSARPRTSWPRPGPRPNGAGSRRSASWRR